MPKPTPTYGRPQVVGEIPPRPRQCGGCYSTRFHLRTVGGVGWLCACCHPPLRERVIVKIPFMADFADRLLSGAKTATSRTRKLAEPGQAFRAFGGLFVIAWAYKITLAEVAENWHRQEGFETPAGFIECWEIIHPRAGWRPEQIVWIHHFAREE